MGHFLTDGTTHKTIYFPTEKRCQISEDTVYIKVGPLA